MLAPSRARRAVPAELPEQVRRGKNEGKGCRQVARREQNHLGGPSRDRQELRKNHLQPQRPHPLLLRRRGPGPAQQDRRPVPVHHLDSDPGLRPAAVLGGRLLVQTGLKPLGAAPPVRHQSALPGEGLRKPGAGGAPAHPADARALCGRQGRQARLQPAPQGLLRPSPGRDRRRPAERAGAEPDCQAAGQQEEAQTQEGQKGRGEAGSADPGRQARGH